MKTFSKSLNHEVIMKKNARIWIILFLFYSSFKNEKQQQKKSPKDVFNLSTWGSVYSYFTFLQTLNSKVFYYFRVSFETELQDQNSKTNCRDLTDTKSILFNCIVTIFIWTLKYLFQFKYLHNEQKYFLSLYCTIAHFRQDLVLLNWIKIID